ncbi:uncharacterized protein LOC121392085 isoform X2 [Gigantopelta aegis]|uniref:uncharacterized protein LOC121392085 isoform X2 n=1 Tax=Gigantopelta aegis TaxID=1735272 RepID=UPI001B887FFE|nr:uncharacterized protein LOC121392085 isoform X2 [Gigantopelta aegis]
MTRNPLYGIYGDLARGDHPVAKSPDSAEFTRSDECQTTRPGGQLGPDNSAHVETTRPRVLRQPGPPRDNSARSPETTCWTSVVF